LARLGTEARTAATAALCEALDGGRCGDEARCACLCALRDAASCGDELALAAGLKCLRHGTWSVRCTAVRCLAALADPEDEVTMGALVSSLADAQEQVRQMAVSVLSQRSNHGSRVICAAACALMSCPREKQPEARRPPGSARHKRPSTATAEPAVAPKHRQVAAAAAVLRQVAEQGDRDVAAAGLACLHSGDQDVRRAGLEALGTFTLRGDQEVSDALCQRLASESEPEPELRSLTAFVLRCVAEPGDVGTTAVLAHVLEGDRSAKVRREAALALGDLVGRGDRDAMGSLGRGAEQDKHPDVRQAALKGLASIADAGNTEAAALLAAFGARRPGG